MVKNLLNIAAHPGQTIKKAAFFGLMLLITSGAATAQKTHKDKDDDEDDEKEMATVIDTVPAFTPHGQLWGCVFGDYDYKANADNLNRGVNQYSGYPMNTNMFQWRRIYLGYNYDISPKFSAEFVLAAEADYQTGVLGQAASGDLLADNKFSPYVKLGNLRWKNIWKGTDLVVGQVNTPAYGINGRNSQTSEEIWGYRSIEKTVSDIRGTNCYDMGAELQGWFDSKGNFGYDLMVGNGTQAKPGTSQFKWFYGDVYAKFLNRRLLIDLYQDYEKLNWGVYTKGSGPWYHDRNTTKLFAAWTTPKLTIGFEGFMTTLLGDVKITEKNGNINYGTTQAMDMSFFVRGPILKDHAGQVKLGFFARFDNYDPSGDLSNIVNNANTKSYTALTAAYDPTTKEQFVVAGLDFTPFKNVHIMPNFWLDAYTSSISPNATNELINPFITNNKGTDVVWRLTFFYIYGK